MATRNFGLDNAGLYNTDTEPKSEITTSWPECKPLHYCKDSSSVEVVNSIYDSAAVPNRAEKTRQKVP